MKRPLNVQPNRPPQVPGYPNGYGQPAGAITYQLNGAIVGRGNTLNITGTGITFTPGADKGTYNFTGTGSGGVTQIVAGSNISVSPPSGLGVVTINATGAGFSPYTIQNGSSIFSTGLTGLWNSTATKSFFSGVNAGDNALGTVDSSIFIGELAGASDLSQVFENSDSVYIGNRAGYNAFRAIDTVGLGHLAGAYATDASYSFFAGAQAGISAQYAGNSFFFGQAAGHNANTAGYSIFMGVEGGYNATFAAFSNFLGGFAGNSATHANNATFIGARAGENDTVNNAGTIGYNTATGTFKPMGRIQSGSGGVAYVLFDDGVGNLKVANSTGTFNFGDVITQDGTGYTANVVTYVPSTSSILIGDYTTTGGGKNSVAIGSHASNAGFSNSIVIGVGGTNTSDNQYAWGDSITHWKFGGNDYTLPFYLPSGTGQYLGASPSGVLNWSVPGASVNSLAVLAATTTVLPFTPTYANGAAGVGATLTAGSNGALVVDGITLVLNDRILVKDQASTLENGVYKLTTVGNGGTPYVLTRTTDADIASQFNDMVVIPAQGTQSATPYGQQDVVVTIGTDAIVFAPQASIYVRQETSGTQIANQIPIYTSTDKTITKGTPDFTYDPTTRTLVTDATTHNVIIGDNTNIGNDVTYSVVVGSNSLFFGPSLTYVTSTGPFNLDSASQLYATTAIGVSCGTNAYFADYSIFAGFGAGQGTGGSPRLNNSIMIGGAAGTLETVNNTGLITYLAETGLFQVGEFVSTGGGQRARVVSDDGLGNIVIVGLRGQLNPGDFITGSISGSTTTISTIIQPHTSILIGDNTSTGGFSDSIALGEGATNTRTNQFMLGPDITRMHLALESYANDGAAGAAGLVAGDWYYNTTTPAVDIKQ